MRLNPFRRKDGIRHDIEVADEALAQAREELEATKARTSHYVEIARNARRVKEDNGLGNALHRAITQGH